MRASRFVPLHVMRTAPPAGLLLLMLVLLSPARAQLTESPATIEPGKLLFEVDGLRLSFDREGGEKMRALGIASTLVSAGLTPTVDFQVGADIFLRETLEVSGRRETSSGIGDLSLRTKWNFWTDERRGSLAVIPYVRLPTGTGAVSAEAVEGGIILPWQSAPRAGFTAGGMLQADVVRDNSGNGHDSAWLLSGYLQRDLTRTFGLYAEMVVHSHHDRSSDFHGTLGAGVLWTLGSHLVLDYELLRGLNSRALDWTHFLRASWKW